MDVLGEHERKKDAILAKKTREYTLGGPYQLKQGGTGALLFKPDWSQNSNFQIIKTVISEMAASCRKSRHCLFDTRRNSVVGEGSSGCNI